MPRTHTDDVGCLFPGILRGPLTIVAGDDLSSHFKIDPANRRIEAVNEARPKRRLLLPLARNIGFSSSALIGTAIDAKSLGAAADGGWYVLPFSVPTDMDVSAPCSVLLPVGPAADGSGGTVVRFEATATNLKDGDTSAVNTTTVYDWTTPSSWTTDDLKLVLIDDGSGKTFAGNLFEAEDIVGLRVQRMGAASQDTYANSILLTSGIVFEYTAKEA